MNKHEHCLHPYMGPIWMVIPDGHVLMKCCRCGHGETKHPDHVWDGMRPGPCKQWGVCP